MKYAIIIIFVAMASFQHGHAQQKKSDILFFGDSITAGHGIAQGDAFPARIQQKIDSLGGNYTVQNGGLSGETSAGGRRRIDWMLQNRVDILVLELGGNDGLRGIDLETTQQNLQQIIEKVKSTYPDAKIVLAGMQVPPNLGTDYTRQFKEMYPKLARQNDIALIPFLLKGVGGRDSLMQSDGIHPNSKGHAVAAETVWNTLKPMLKK